MTTTATQPALPVHPHVAAAAQQVATAKATVDRLAPALSEKQAAERKLAARIGEMEAAKAAILQRRREVGEEPDDAGRITIIEDDIGDLENLHSEAGAASPQRGGRRSKLGSTTRPHRKTCAGRKQKPRPRRSWNTCLRSRPHA